MFPNMMQKTKLFFDCEFTGLHQNTTLISIGFVSENDKTFYAEFNDFDSTQLDEWLKENVIKHLKFNDYFQKLIETKNDISYKSNTKNITKKLTKWLEQFGEIEIFSDCLSYDWVLFCQLFGGALNIPKNVYYIPFDICTMFKMKGIDPDISREEFSETKDSIEKHNSLFDAEVIKKCFLKLEGV